MAPRQSLHEILKDLLGSGNVYFQPPSNVRMKYPAIVYSRDDIKTDFADNRPYKNMRRYQVTVIDKDPDSDIHEKLLDLPRCSYDRFFAAEDLNHDVYNLYY